ncbi:MAG: formate dehydrogenase, partial [Steroidobacteraceae bacterium]|nr:formate dehydrogenase [Steroidobacteraceae bacterium]
LVTVPQDAGALSLGADSVARAVESGARARGREVRVVRTGSRGAYWLEPLVEVTTAAGRIAYGPVTAADVPQLLDAGFLDGGVHPLRLGDLATHPWFAGQQRLTSARLGLVDPASLDDYVAHGGYAGLTAALDMSPQEIVRTVTDSGLRGRGGAAFPTGIKWQTVLDQAAGQKFIACNADEGDSGTFADRMLMEGDPFAVIEGMTIAGVAVGATRGYIYLRVEYPHAARALAKALDAARERGYLGRDLRGSGRDFDIAVRLGAGAYICGEETSMLESLEGRRGEVRVRPPLPAIKGLFGQPTVVNNVVTLATVPVILARGAAFYRDYGVGKSRGTLPLQLAGNVCRGGLVERAFGLTVRELVFDYGGGSASGRPVRAVQIGGPLGAYLPESQFDTPLDYEALAANDALLGHGGVVVFDDTVDMARMSRYALEFCAIESCGKCTPCRVGSTRGVELIDRILLARSGAADANASRSADLALLDELCDTMLNGSLCGLGGMTPFPVRSAMKHFREDFERGREKKGTDLFFGVGSVAPLDARDRKIDLSPFSPIP